MLPGSCSCLAATNTPTGAHSKYSGTCWNYGFSHTGRPLKHLSQIAFGDLRLVKSLAHLAVCQSCESSFGLGWLEELYDGGESWGWQQHPAQRAVSWEQRLQLWRRHSSWKVFHQDHVRTPRCCGLYAQSTRGIDRVTEKHSYFYTIWIELVKIILRTWLNESKQTLLSSRNCRVSWTICVSPKAILTATLPFDS